MCDPSNITIHVDHCTKYIGGHDEMLPRHMGFLCEWKHTLALNLLVSFSLLLNSFLLTYKHGVRIIVQEAARGAKLLVSHFK